MQFVNVTTHSVFTSFSGHLSPGQVSADGGAKRRHLEEALAEVVKVCGNSLGIRLNQREAELLKKLMDLDEKGGGFDKNTLPPEVRDDPTGEKRNSEFIRASQQAEIDNRSNANAKAAHRESVINGEISERTPVGPATMKGEKVDPGKLKSGFEQIMEENARIASGKQETNVGEVLDPIGAHAKNGAENAEFHVEHEDKVPGGEPVSVSMANHLEGDGTKSADAMEPIPTITERGSEMDRKAAEIASGLSTMGPVDAKGRKAKKSKAK